MYIQFTTFGWICTAFFINKSRNLKEKEEVWVKIVYKIREEGIYE